MRAIRSFLHQFILTTLTFLSVLSLSNKVFALVTTSGSLIAYNMNVPPKAMVKMTAHSGDATTLDWHPLHSGIIATGGASDRSVKVWDLDSYLNILDGGTTNKKDEGQNMERNLNTLTSHGTEDSSETDRSSNT